MSIKVYISSPYTKGDKLENVKRQIEAAEILRNYGCLPFVPLLSHFWNKLSAHPYEYWMDMDIEWIYSCSCVLRLSGESVGAQQECEEAKRLGLPVFYDVYELIAFYALVEQT